MRLLPPPPPLVSRRSETASAHPRRPLHHTTPLLCSSSTAAAHVMAAGAEVSGLRSSATPPRSSEGDAASTDNKGSLLELAESLGAAMVLGTPWLGKLAAHREMLLTCLRAAVQVRMPACTRGVIGAHVPALGTAVWRVGVLRACDLLQCAQGMAFTSFEPTPAPASFAVCRLVQETPITR